MSTRATYSFECKEKFKPLCFYIHCDGYLEGAMEYLFRAIKFQNQAGNYTLAESFFRANPRAEFTRGHDAHGDTEFRYSFELEESGNVKLFTVEASSFDSDAWRKIAFGGPRELRDLINNKRGRFGEDASKEQELVLLIEERFNGRFPKTISRLTTDARMLAEITSRRDSEVEYSVKYGGEARADAARDAFEKAEVILKQLQVDALSSMLTKPAAV